LLSGDMGHGKVEEDDPHAVLGQQLQGLAAVGAGDDVAQAGALQAYAHGVEPVGLVIHQKDAE